MFGQIRIVATTNAQNQEVNFAIVECNGIDYPVKGSYARFVDGQAVTFFTTPTTRKYKAGTTLAFDITNDADQKVIKAGTALKDEVVTTVQAKAFGLTTVSVHEQEAHEAKLELMESQAAAAMAAVSVA